MFSSTKVHIWLQNQGITIILIILIAYLIERFGSMLLAYSIHRTVGAIHTDQSEDDVRKRQETLIGMFSAVFRVLVIFTAIFMILAQFGINLAPLLAGASVLGVALGFGAQSLIKDFLSGLFIIIENQYRVGDVVDIQGAIGTVEQITIRSTVVRDSDGNVHYIPNGSIVQVINKTMGFSKINFTISVAADSSLDTLSEIINTVGEKLAKDPKWKDKLLDAPHFAGINSFTNTTLEVRIVGTTAPSQQWSTTGELRKRLLSEFKKHDIISTSTPPATPKK